MRIIQCSRVLCGVYLLVLGMMDWKAHKLPVWMLDIGGVLACIYQITCREKPFLLIFAGAMVGLVFLVISKVTREAFGSGDSILIGILGVYLGFWNLLTLLLWAFLFAAVVSVFVLILKKFKRKSALPFVPCLGCGYVALLLMGGFF